MPKYDFWEGFMREWRKLTPEQRHVFEGAWRAIVASMKTTGALPAPPFVQKMRGHEIYEVRWAPNGRATFHIEQDAQGDDVIVWRHIGDHSILRHP